MGNTLKANKIIAFILILSLIWSDFAFCVQGLISIAETEKLANVKLTQEVSKYAQYKKTDTEKGVVIQTHITMQLENVEESEDDLIVEKTTIETQAPEYEGIKPDSVEVIAYTTKATNGNDGQRVLTNSEYTYNASTGIVTITIENGNEEKSNGQDEYYVTYYYGATAYSKYEEITHLSEYAGQDPLITKMEKDPITGQVKVYIVYNDGSEPPKGVGPGDPENPLGFQGDIKILQPISIQIVTNANVKLKRGTKTAVEENRIENEIQLDINISDINGVRINSDLTELSKGEILARQNQEGLDSMEYYLEEEFNISRIDLARSIELIDATEYMINNNGEEETIQDSLYYKETKVNKNQFESILGNNGEINITDSDENIIATINSSTPVDEDGNYYIQYNEPKEKIYIFVSQPIKNGILRINHKKQISNNLRISNINEVLRNNFILRIWTGVTVTNPDSTTTEIANITEYNHDIKINDLKTKASLSISNTNLSTINKNEYVQFEINLHNSS